MNEDVKKIAEQYQVNEEVVAQILSGLKIRRKNPDERQLRGIETVCRRIQEGKSVEEAIAAVKSEAEGESADESIEVSGFDKFGVTPQQMEKLKKVMHKLGEEAASKTLEDFPFLAAEQVVLMKQELIAAFVTGFKNHIIARFQDPNFYQDFMLALQGGEAELLGKMRVLSGSATNNRLLESTATSS